MSDQVIYAKDDQTKKVSVKEKRWYIANDFQWFFKFSYHNKMNEMKIKSYLPQTCNLTVLEVSSPEPGILVLNGIRWSRKGKNNFIKILWYAYKYYNPRKLKP